MPTPTRIIERRVKEAPCCGGANIITHEALGGGVPCEDTMVSFITNGDFSIPVDQDPPLGLVNTWGVLTQPGPATFLWSAGAMHQTANESPEGSYLYYDCLDSVGNLSKQLDMSRTLFYSFEITPVVQRLGYSIILTLLAQQPVTFANHYYQIEFASTTYGTMSGVVNPADWILGNPPPGTFIPSGIYNAFPVVFLIRSHFAGSGFNHNDDYTFDNVVIGQTYCI